jgi:hypothetical protein
MPPTHPHATCFFSTPPISVIAFRPDMKTSSAPSSIIPLTTHRSKHTATFASSSRLCNTSQPTPVLTSHTTPASYTMPVTIHQPQQSQKLKTCSYTSGAPEPFTSSTIRVYPNRATATSHGKMQQSNSSTPTRLSILPTSPNLFISLDTTWRTTHPRNHLPLRAQHQLADALQSFYVKLRR